MTINARLRAVLEALGKNPRVFALEAGINPAVFHNVVSEKGRQNAPGYEMLEKILLSFDNISTDYLFKGIGDPLLPKNDPHTKKVAEGVRIEEKKGGKDWGKDSGFSADEKHIKRENRIGANLLTPTQVQELRAAQYNKIQEQIRKGRNIEPETLEDSAKPAYGDLAQMIEMNMNQQGAILRVLVRRLEALERKLEQHEAPPPHTGEGADLG